MSSFCEAGQVLTPLVLRAGSWRRKRFVNSYFALRGVVASKCRRKEIRHAQKGKDFE
jgi:hypothetical protein